MPDKEREIAEEGATKRNAQSIYVGGVNFRVDKGLLQRTNSLCHLSRAPWKPTYSSDKYTPEQRLALAQQYLEEHPYLTVRAYRQLTGLVHATATVELRKWAHTSGTGIDISGYGSHRVYVKGQDAEVNE